MADVYHDSIVIFQSEDGVPLAKVHCPPARPLEFKDWIKKCRSSCFKKPEVEFPCFHCGGTGWIYDPNDSPCPVEGRKMMDMIDCPSCKGSGEMPERYLRADYEVYKDEVTKNYHDALEELEVVQFLLSRISPESVKILRDVIQNEDHLPQHTATNPVGTRHIVCHPMYPQV